MSTEQEREALIDVMVMTRLSDYAATDMSTIHQAVDAILAAGFRRSEVPEPSTECPQPCVHLSQHDAREGRTCAEHPCTCPEPQGEPSDLVRAALRAALRAAGGVR